MTKADSLAERVRAARLKTGLSARAIDSLAGLGAGHCALIEAGIRSNISLQTAQALADALEVSLEWLATGREP